MSQHIKHFKKNTTGRDFVVGDIHGHFTKLQSQLEALGFNPDGGDRLFSVGDLVDRSDDSADCFAWLQQPWFHAIAGNHEDMAIVFALAPGLQEWYRSNGGAWNIRNDQATREWVAEQFEKLPLAIDIETDNGLVGLVHANCPFPSWNRLVDFLEDEDDPSSIQRFSHWKELIQWDRSRINKGDASGVKGLHALVVGHTPLREVEKLGNVYHIDTGGWASEKRKFTILDISTL